MRNRDLDIISLLRSGETENDIDAETMFNAETLDVFGDYDD